MGLDQHSYQTMDYGREDRQKIDVFTPGDNANGKGLFFIHGGGWSAGHRSQWHPVAHYFRVKGFLCASIGYRLAPVYNYASQLEDIRSAVAALTQNAASLGIEEKEFALIGSSAGGHLAAMLSAMPADEKLGLKWGQTRMDTQPKAAVLYCPATDLRPESNEPGLLSSISGLLGEDINGESRHEELFRKLSPLFYSRGRSAARTLILHGDADDTIALAQSQAYHQMLQENGTDSRLVVLEGVHHGFGYGVDSEAQKLALGHIEQFLHSVFALPSGGEARNGD
ncbi:alpha/beta hydrolase [Paenibacillus senegalensis]|uniref:alpha/beta hydrolase n=1 Tax=Paenibacillus senegalensis TaxID=1465766 RepID=UPI000287B522|nr:alpha/beta hydrolase [Paenibacillus senegalensis]